jgi:hypothetical protein
VRRHGDQLARSEALAQAATVAWHRGARPAADPGVERACTRLDALSESWQRLGVGETMSVSRSPRRSR